MKIALVNLCKIEDYSQTKYYQESIDFLTENGIGYVDYFSGRSTPEALLAGFHDAVNDPEADLVWFIQGGSSLVRFINKIDWKLVQETNKGYMGLSDFTHFAIKAVSLGKTCFYGHGLKNIKTYFPNEADRSFLVQFLLKRDLPRYDSKQLTTGPGHNLENEKIIGGHSFISAVMLPLTKVDLSDRFVLFEHHYVPGETISSARYFLEAVKLTTVNNRPKGFVLGHSILVTQDGQSVEVEELNRVLLNESLLELNLPVYYIDHFKTLIKLS